MDLLEGVAILLIFLHIGYIPKIKKFIDNSTDISWVILGEVSLLLFIVWLLTFRFIPGVENIWLLVMSVIGSLAIISMRLKLKSYKYTGEAEYNRDKYLLQQGYFGIGGLIFIQMIFFVISYLL